MVWSGMRWYDMIMMWECHDMIMMWLWYDVMIGCDNDMIWSRYDMLVIWYDMMIGYDMLWYDSGVAWCGLIWYDMIWWVIKIMNSDRDNYDNDNDVIMTWYVAIATWSDDAMWQWYDMVWYDLIWYIMIGSWCDVMIWEWDGPMIWQRYGDDMVILW